MFKGSCLCGSIQYQITEFDQGFMFCHCSRCRKASGSAFASNASVKTVNFKIVEGQESLKLFKTAAGVTRSFCNHCGSPIYSQRETTPEMIRIRMGTLNTPLNGIIKPSAHIFVESKAEWDTIADQLPQYPEYPK